MSVAFFDFRAQDAMRIALQRSQLIEAGIDSRDMTIEQAEDLARWPAWTARAIGADDAPGRILCCAGFRETFAGRQASAWAMLAEAIAPHALLAITRFARARIAESPLIRIESLTADRAAERQWAELVGLRFNTHLHGWGAASETMCLYERVKPW